MVVVQEDLEKKSIHLEALEKVNVELYQFEVGLIKEFQLDNGENCLFKGLKPGVYCLKFETGNNVNTQLIYLIEQSTLN